MYKEDLALNNLQWLTCHKTKANLKKISKITTKLQQAILNLFHLIF